MDIYEMILDDEDLLGVFAYSLVSSPANKAPIFLLSEEEKVVEVEKPTIHLSSDEKRIITGILLQPNQVIERNRDGEKFGIVFREEQIENLMVHFAKNNRHNFINIEHDGGYLDGLTTFESWKVGKNDKIHQFRPETPEGSWAVSLKVEQDEVWQLAKEGKIKGFSVEVNVNKKLVKKDPYSKKLDELKAILDIK